MTAAVLSTAEAREVTMWSLSRRGEVVHHGHRLRAYVGAAGRVTLWDEGEGVKLFTLTLEVTSATRHDRQAVAP